MTYEEAQNQAIEAAKAAIIEHYATAREQLSKAGAFGKELDRKARKHALKLGGFELPEGWTIAMVTPANWGRGALGYRANTAKDMRCEQKS
jgi:hypothetical protein